MVARALVATLERAWATIVELHPKVPDVVVVVAPGSGGRARELKLGLFAAARWEVAGSQRSELLEAHRRRSGLPSADRIADVLGRRSAPCWGDQIADSVRRCELAGGVRARELPAHDRHLSVWPSARWRTSPSSVVNHP